MENEASEKRGRNTPSAGAGIHSLDDETLDQRTQPGARAKLPPLSDEYHKSRKQLVLWSAILITWEVVGFDHSKLNGTAGDVFVAIRPEAVPWILAAVVAYFSFRMLVEWAQCSEERRQLTASMLDVRAAAFIAGAANLTLVIFEIAPPFIAWMSTWGPNFQLSLSVSVAVLVPLVTYLAGRLGLRRAWKTIDVISEESLEADERRRLRSTYLDILQIIDGMLNQEPEEELQGVPSLIWVLGRYPLPFDVGEYKARLNDDAMTRRAAILDLKKEVVDRLLPYRQG